MTKLEFMQDYERLCDGFRYQSTPEQSAAWYKKIGHTHANDWREAVDTLLCGPRFPLLDPVLVACEQASGHRKRQQAQQERMEAQRFFQGSVVYRKGDDPIERAYNAMRMTLLKSAYQPGQTAKEYAQRHVEGLSAWISVKAHAEWAKTMPMGECVKHSGPHTVLRCISDELKFWMEQAQGKGEAAQRCGACNGRNHEPGECWPWQTDQERERRLRLPYWQDRMRANGLDQQAVLSRKALLEKTA